MYAKKRKRKKMQCYVVCVYVCLSVYRMTENASFSTDGLELALNPHRHHHHCHHHHNHHHHHHQHLHYRIAAWNTRSPLA